MTTWNPSVRCPDCDCCPAWVCALARLHRTECWHEAPDPVAALLCPCARGDRS